MAANPRGSDPQALVRFIRGNYDIIESGVEKVFLYSYVPRFRMKDEVVENVRYMVEQIEARSGQSMFDSDIKYLMSQYNNKLAGSPKSFKQHASDKGKTLKDLIEKFVKKLTPDEVIKERINKVAQEVGINPDVLTSRINVPYPAQVTYDQIKAVAKDLKSRQIDPATYMSSKALQTTIDEVINQERRNWAYRGQNFSVDRNQVLQKISEVCNKTKLPLSYGDIGNRVRALLPRQ